MGKPTSGQSNPAELERAFRQKIFAPIYYFYGEEDMLIEETLGLLIKSALDESTKSFNLDIVGGERVDAKEIVSLASAFPMVSKWRVVIVKNLSLVEKPELLVPIIENPVASTVLVIIGDRLDMRLKFSKAIQNNGVVTEFRQLPEKDISAWISRRISERGKSADLDTCQVVQSFVGQSLREIQNEIDKLFIYVGDKPRIEKDDVTAVVGLSKRYNIFELQRAIGSKNIVEALEICERMIESGEYPVAMIAMLTKYFGNLWIIRDFIDGKMSRDELIKGLGISPKQLWFLDDEIRRARAFSTLEIEKAFSILLETDEKLKSSDANPKLLFTLMLYNLIRH